jgi:hypothetical protein
MTAAGLGPITHARIAMLRAMNHGAPKPRKSVDARPSRRWGSYADRWKATVKSDRIIGAGSAITEFNYAEGS